MVGSGVCVKEREIAGGTMCKTHMLCESCESRAGMRELREAEKELEVYTWENYTWQYGEWREEVFCNNTVNPRGSFCT